MGSCYLKIDSGVIIIRIYAYTILSDLLRTHFLFFDEKSFIDDDNVAKIKS